MWRPRTLADVEAAIGLEENSQLDFKRDFTTAAETAKDIAAMTVEGGVIAYGIDEQDLAAAELTPVALRGAEERVRQIADSAIDPPPLIEVDLIESRDDGAGFVIVAIPASPLAPHMWKDRFPARSGTTTRYLSQREVERLYEQRRSYVSAATTRRFFGGFLKHERGLGFDDVRANTARLLIMVEPIGEYRHPNGSRVRDPLVSATAEAKHAYADLVDDNVRSFLLEQVGGARTWEPQSTSGFKAGRTVLDDDSFQEMSVAGAATYAHSGPLSFEISVGLGRLAASEPSFAHEQLWVAETIAALIFSGRLFRAVPGITFVHVDLHLWGLQGRTHSRSTQRSFVSGRRGIDDNAYSETNTFVTGQLVAQPDEVAAELLDRLLTSFEAEDVLAGLVREDG